MANCFIKITNKDIYDKITEIDRKIEDSLLRHTENKSKIQKLNWAVGVLFTLIFFVMGILITKGG